LADKLSITKTEQGEVVLFRLNGMLNANTEVQFVEAARREKESGARYLLVDMGGVVMITSAGLRALHDAMYLFTPRAEIDAYQKANPGDLYKSGYFKLAGATANVYSVLNLAGFLHNIPIFPDVKQALESFK
jgi:hypothetical protein